MTDKTTKNLSLLPDYLIKKLSKDLPEYSPIKCQLYDYIEIACMRNYLLDIELTTGEVLRGKAKQTRIKEKQEFLVIKLNAAEATQENKDQCTELFTGSIRLDLIKSITVLDKNADFKTININ